MNRRVHHDFESIHQVSEETRPGLHREVRQLCQCGFESYGESIIGLEKSSNLETFYDGGEIEGREALQQLEMVSALRAKQAFSGEFRVAVGGDQCSDYLGVRLYSNEIRHW